MKIKAILLQLKALITVKKTGKAQKLNQTDDVKTNSIKDDESTKRSAKEINNKSCKFGTKCKNPKCTFIHSNDIKSNVILCKFGNKCLNSNCTYKHPPLCKFGAHCSNPYCIYIHPVTEENNRKLCKFGIRCRNTNCIFIHPEKEESKEITGTDDKSIDTLSITLPSTPPHLKNEE